MARAGASGPVGADTDGRLRLLRAPLRRGGRITVEWCGKPFDAEREDFLLRVAGKRTLSKLNVFDFVFALGSPLANTIISTGVALADGVTALAALKALQILLSWQAVTL